MKTVGIIAEYNPFHNGHKKHIEKSKNITNSDHAIVVMSGNYVQRGTPAILNKYIRTKIALENGADVVIELPVHFSTSSAEFFSSAAVHILSHIGIVDSLCFGSETGDLETLKKIALYLNNEPENYKNCLRNFLKEGFSYPDARSNALKNILNIDPNIIKSPNNILAIEYLKALEKLKNPLEAFTIKREIADYHSTEIYEELASATAVRKAISENNFASCQNVVPNFDFYKKILEFTPINNINNYSHLFHYILASRGKDYVRSILDVTEGLENRIFSCANDSFLIEDILNSVKTKRFTRTKLQRAIMHILLDITKNEFELLSYPRYARILGFRKDSSHLLHNMKKNSSIPIFTNLKDSKRLLDPEGTNMLQKEIFSTDLYYLTSGNASAKNIEFMEPVIIIH